MGEGRQGHVIYVGATRVVREAKQAPETRQARRADTKGFYAAHRQNCAGPPGLAGCRFNGCVGG
ncbi:hypothetical protein UC8_00420 [Roseimaritima ulvae]|uniref:Uncharacterized protein n=1 Tax=Roseimaritima ulvae TaxID=980254 RepID=A0A5B9QJ97_9BACT|nr:hypothetical protein UC8_00420 [Roseimaritima ulvae]